MAYSQITSDSIRTIAKQVRLVADGYDAIATEAESDNLTAFDVRGIETLYVTIERMEGNLNSLRKSLMDARRKQSKTIVNTPIPPTLGTLTPVGRKKAAAKPPAVQPQAKKGKATG
jgi:hypothetical protein